MAGQTVAEAKETLKKANFEIGEEKSEASEKVEEGRIIRTDPEAGKRLERRFEKSIWLSHQASNPSN